MISICIIYFIDKVRRELQPLINALVKRSLSSGISQPIASYMGIVWSDAGAVCKLTVRYRTSLPYLTEKHDHLSGYVD